MVTVWIFIRSGPGASLLNCDWIHLKISCTMSLISYQELRPNKNAWVKWKSRENQLFDNSKPTFFLNVTGCHLDRTKGSRHTSMDDLCHRLSLLNQSEFRFPFNVDICHGRSWDIILGDRLVPESSPLHCPNKKFVSTFLVAQTSVFLVLWNYF